VIKNVAYFPLQAAGNSAPVMAAVLESLRHAGIDAVENSMTSDAVILWSVLWSGRMAKNRTVYQHYRSQGRPVIVIDIGSLRRGTTWKVAINNITAEGYYGHTQELDWDRPARLGINLGTAERSGSHIVIAAQNSASLQVQDLSSMESWIAQQVAQIRAHTDRKIRVRPHPRCRLAVSQLPPGIDVELPRRVPDTYDSFDLQFDCHAMVNYNSGPGIQAAIQGVRPLVHSSSLAHPVSVSVSDIERPYETDRSQWLVEICHTEYTVEEIRQGSWLQRLDSYPWP
jgi:hypothetical protein